MLYSFVLNFKKEVHDDWRVLHLSTFLNPSVSIGMGTTLRADHNGMFYRDVFPKVRNGECCDLDLLICPILFFETLTSKEMINPTA